MWVTEHHGWNDPIYMSVNTHPHANVHTCTYTVEGGGQELSPNWMGEGKTSGIFYNKHVWFLQKHQNYHFFKFRKHNKVTFHRHFKSFGKPWFSSQQQHSRRHQEGNPPERCPPSPFPPKSRKALGWEEGSSPRPGWNPCPFLSHLVCHSRRLSPNHSLKKEFAYREEQGGTFSVTSEEGLSPTCGLHTIALPLLRVTCSGLSDPSAKAASGITVTRTFRETLWCQVPLGGPLRPSAGQSCVLEQSLRCHCRAGSLVLALGISLQKTQGF